MAEQQTHKINNPHELAEWIVQSNESNRSKTLRIALLQPLSDPNVLATTRSTALQHPIGEKKYEMLDLLPLCNAWRQEWKKLTRDAIQSVIFDITLPNMRGPGDNERSYWSKFMIDEAGVEIGIHSNVPERLVVLLATELKMKTASDKPLKMEYVCESREPGAPPKKDLWRALKRLSSENQSS